MSILGGGSDKGTHSPPICSCYVRRLSSLIPEDERREVLRGVDVSPSAPRISHLLFADDTLIFWDATRDSALEISHILHRYSLASG